MSKRKQHRVILTRAPIRAARTTEIEEPRSDQWLDCIDPKRERYTKLVSGGPRDITREEAREFLLHVPDYQRNLKSRNIKDYTADMNDKYWVPGVPNVVFDRKGELINGHHVLVAFLASAMETINCMVIINRDPNAYLGYDLGVKRSLADNLKGETEMPNQVGKALKVIQQWDLGVFKGKGYMAARDRPQAGDNGKGGGILSGRRGREFLEKHPGISQHVFANPFKGSKGTRSIAAMHAASYRLHQTDPDLAAKFFHGLRTGEDLDKGNPILALRRSFQHMREDESWRSGVTMAYLLVAWKLFLAGEKVERLPFRIGQPFPEIS